MKSLHVVCCLVLLGAGTASAQVLMDLEAVDPAMIVDFLGDWSIQNGDGSKACKVTLSREVTIGGLAIGLDPDCAKVFPVMGEVVAWRLYEDWQIVLVDATRRSLIRFSTPRQHLCRRPRDGRHHHHREDRRRAGELV